MLYLVMCQVIKASLGWRLPFARIATVRRYFTHRIVTTDHSHSRLGLDLCKSGLYLGDCIRLIRYLNFESPDIGDFSVFSLSGGWPRMYNVLDPSGETPLGVVSNQTDGFTG